MLENVPQNCVVAVDGEKLIVMRHDGGSVTIKGRPGDHRISIKQRDRSLMDKPVTLIAGNVIRLPVPRAPEVRAGDAAIVLTNVPSGAVVEVDGDRVPVNPTAGVPIAVKSGPGKHVVLVKLGRDVLLVQT